MTDLSLFDYELKPELIAQEPKEPRDHSRLLILNRNGEIIHKKFYQILNFLDSGDVLVFNNTEVVNSRLFGKKFETSGKVEIFLLRPSNKAVFDETSWPAKWIIISRPKLKKSLKIKFSHSLSGEIEKENLIVFNKQGETLKKEISKLGQVPLPPYIKHPTSLSFKNYQTVYAKNKGSVAAPTAGFHFTEKLLDKIREKGTETEFLTLHVGLGTFEPIRVKEIEKHQMQPEYFSLSKETAFRLNEAKIKKKRIIAVGTTVTRALEHCVDKNGFLKPKKGWNSLFIYPGFKFKFVDSLITNFHLPQSTLLLLVSAFVESATADKRVFTGRELILKAYQEAIKEKYRFYSFGDTMFII